MQRFLGALVLFFSFQAYADEFPDVTECLSSYTNQGNCTQDCDCGWCNASNVCLNGYPDGPMDEPSLNKNYQCDLKHWNYSDYCRKESVFEGRLFFGLFAFGLATAGICTFGYYVAQRARGVTLTENSAYDTYGSL